MLQQGKVFGHSFAWKTSGVPILNWFLEKQHCPRCHTARCEVLGWTLFGGGHLLPHPHPPTDEMLTDGEAEAGSAGITASHQGDVIHERRKNTTQFTFAPSWRADYILHSEARTPAPRRGGKTGRGQLFMEELSGTTRIRYMPAWCQAGSEPQSVPGAFWVAISGLPSFVLSVQFPLRIIHPSLCIAGSHMPKATVNVCLKITFSVRFFIQRLVL